MVLHIMIKNFGKIESADIALHDLVVFVGNSNSGKTMVMQLIYGCLLYTSDAADE